MSEIPKSTARWVLYWTVVAGVLLVLIACSSVIRRAHAFDPHIIASATHHGLPPALVSAVIWKESRYDVQAQGEAGEIGLMQITPGAAEDWSRAHPATPFQVDHLWHPHTNITVGTWYLARAVDHWEAQDYQDPLPFALAEYNAGRRNAARWAAGSGGDAKAFVEAISFASTQAYVKEVLLRSRGGL